LFDSLVFSATQWTLPAALLLLGCALLAFWSYFRSRGPVGLRLAAATLKLLAFALLAICLVEPVQQLERPLPGANTLAILVDNSSSMQLRASGDSRSRAEQLRAVLQPDTAWQMRLSQDFSVKKYLFDQRLQAVEDLGVAEFQGQYSMLGNALTSLRTRFANQPMAGVVLLSDGIATDLPKLDDELLKQFPIYPVLNAGQADFKDISIGQTSVSLSSFELSPATVEALIQCHGMAGREVTVRIFDSAGKTLEKKSFKAESDDFQQRLKFQVRPPDVGWQTV
jgi:hypothetical protein